MSCRTGVNFQMFVHTSVHPPLRLFRPQISPLWLQISPQDLKSALQASNQLFRPQICPLGLKPAPQASNLLFWTKCCHPDFKSASGRLEIHPCPTGHRPFGATAQKGSKELLKNDFCLSRERYWEIINSHGKKILEVEAFLLTFCDFFYFP